MRSLVRAFIFPGPENFGEIRLIALKKVASNIFRFQVQAFLWSSISFLFVRRLHLPENSKVNKADKGMVSIKFYLF